jgi:hypothetical protein
MVEWKSDGKLPKSVQDQRSALRDKLARRHFRPEINAADLARKRYLLESEVEPPRAFSSSAKAEVDARREDSVRRLASGTMPKIKLKRGLIRALDALDHRTRTSRPSKLKK